MTEFARDTTDASVSLNVAGADVTSVVFKRGGKEIGSASSSPAPLPYAITHQDGEFTVLWKYTVEGIEYQRPDSHTIVTPLFTREELNEYNAQFTSLQPAQFNILERMVRHIIQKYTGQEFGFFAGTINAIGSGFNSLTLSRRALSVSSIAYADGTTPTINLNREWSLTNGGFIVRPLAGYLADSIKVPSYEEIVNETGVIFDPYTASRVTFRNTVEYAVTGEFGWHSVPDAVKQAALILAVEFSCKEATWRDRYIRSIRTADWGFTFNSGAFAGTGSVSADLLLADYVVNNMGAV